jgi:2-dehydro-3-deoxygluconokinase
MKVGADPVAALDLLAIGETMVLVGTEPGCPLTAGAAATVSTGGAESNVAVGVASQGLHAAWFSRLGTGPLGDLVLDGIADRGVDTTAVIRDPSRPTGLMVKHAAADRSRVFYYRSGSAASALSRSDIALLPSARVVHVSGITAALSGTCREFLEAVVGRREVPGARVSFDVNHRPALWARPDEAAAVLLAFARAADVVFVGRDEAEALWGTATADEVRRLLPDVPHLVVKDGAVEAVEFSGADVTRVPAEVVEVVDPVGAGDAFAAGWLSRWLRGAGAAARLSGGHAAAAAVLASPTDLAAIIAGPRADKNTTT